MTSFRIFSDTHFEFHPDGGRAFLDSLDVQPDEVLLLAGDACSSRWLIGALSALCRRFAHVVYVVGNHEFYGSDRDGVARALERVSAKHPNFSPLNRTVMTLASDVRILGCPLWFMKSYAPKHQMNDFRLIRNFESWVYEENAASINFLRREMRAGDVVLTHYLPSQKSVAPRWQGSPLNPFFVCDVEPLIVDRQPALWVHGHTHDSCDYTIGKTRVLCNPFGYLGHEVNEAFVPDMRVTLPAMADSGVPECPGEHCMMCNGEACNKCGAGCWNHNPYGSPPCEHSVDERHEAPDIGN